MHTCKGRTVERPQAYIDGPMFIGEFKERQPWAGEQPYYVVRCKACDESLGKTMLTSREDYSGRVWSKKHEVFVGAAE